jgi:hypothetical protein
MTVLITLTIPLGGDVNNFSLSSNIGGYATTFETNVSAAALAAGYLSSLVPNGTTTIRVRSTGLCTNFVDIPVTLLPTPTTTTTTTPTPYAATCGVINVSQVDLDDATGNDGSITRQNNTVYSAYKNNLGNEVFSGTNAASNNFVCGGNSGAPLPHIFYYKNNIKTPATVSSIVFSASSCVDNDSCSSNITLFNNITTGSGNSITGLTGYATWTSFIPANFPIGQGSSVLRRHNGYTGNLTVTATVTVNARVEITKNGVFYKCKGLVGTGAQSYVFSGIDSVTFLPTDTIIITLLAGETCP